MTGLILCGGQSSRMGSDKGLLPEPALPGQDNPPEGSSMAEKSARILLLLGIPVALSLRPAQLDAYNSILPQLLRITDDPTCPAAGPLLGILSAHRHYPSQDLLVMACDLPRMTQEFPARLMSSYDFGYAEAVVFRQADGTAEPLCAIYAAAGLRRINRLLMQGKLKKHSLMGVLELLRTQIIPLENSAAAYFLNANTRQDLT